MLRPDAFRGEKEMGIKGWNVALGIVLLLVSSAAFAGNAAAVRRQIESSMLLTGKIQVDAAGLPGTRRTTRTRCRPASWG